MADHYEPTPDQIATECAKIRAERLALMRERPDTDETASQVRACRVPGDADDDLIV